MLPDPVVDQISKRCIGAYEVISGKTTMESLGLLGVDEGLSKLRMICLELRLV